MIPVEGETRSMANRVAHDEDHQQAAFRADWQACSLYSGDVEVLGDAGGGGSRPSRVRLKPANIIAFAKPAFSRGGVPEGAHEFIASELSHMMTGVTVPPVGFWKTPTGELFALSIRAFQEPITWGDALPALTADDHVALRPVFSASCVFHTWINDVDHNGHPGNLIVDAKGSPGNPKVAFIDHAFALTHQWSDGSPPAAMPPHYYAQADDFVAKEVAATIERVHSISREARKSLILRIPTEFLPAATADAILNCLERRANELTSAFAAVLRR